MEDSTLMGITPHRFSSPFLFRYITMKSVPDVAVYTGSADWGARLLSPLLVAALHPCWGSLRVWPIHHGVSLSACGVSRCFSVGEIEECHEYSGFLGPFPCCVYIPSLHRQ